MASLLGIGDESVHTHVGPNRLLLSWTGRSQPRHVELRVQVDVEFRNR